ncbi:unnamed protein product [Diatraea saccharalis]|uniref:Uncharacterized protein n=1 Tax=Diatraea saccharalis TaxID=40085 RepID=A0A9P0C4C1_9NEOP|nr:unnamed protein product [Diatraea saccharalis]
MKAAKKSDAKKPHINGVIKFLKTSSIEWPEYITELNLSNSKIRWQEENIKFPPNVMDLNISHNELTEVPSAVLNLEKLKNLDISYNIITYFDEYPKFCHAIEVLNLSHNNLHGPPYWVWTGAPIKLTNINLGFNYNLRKSFECSYFEELLQYTTQLINIKINNCSLTQHLKLLITLPKAKVLELGSSTLSLFSMNRIHEVPCEELKKCCDMERLNLSNVQLYTIKNNIDILSKLVEINLSHNEISNIPDEFCNLEHLEICNLSYNHILYLPDNISKLGRLVSLQINSNELCMLPESISELKKLQILDLYDNSLYEIPDGLKNIAEIDLAQNYFDEPEELNYLEKRDRLRLSVPDRFNGK